MRLAISTPLARTLRGWNPFGNFLGLLRMQSLDFLDWARAADSWNRILATVEEKVLCQTLCVPERDNTMGGEYTSPPGSYNSGLCWSRVSAHTVCYSLH